MRLLQRRGFADRTLGADRVDPEADNLRQVLFIDHAVFLRVAPDAGGAGKLTVDAFLYDLRNRQRLSNVKSVVPAEKPGGAVMTAAAWVQKLGAAAADWRRFEEWKQQPVAG